MQYLCTFQQLSEKKCWKLREKNWKWKQRTRFLINEIKRWMSMHTGIELYLYATAGVDIRDYLTKEKKRGI